MVGVVLIQALASGCGAQPGASPAITLTATASADSDRIETAVRSDRDCYVYHFIWRPNPKALVARDVLDLLDSPQDCTLRADVIDRRKWIPERGSVLFVYCSPVKCGEWLESVQSANHPGDLGVLSLRRALETNANKELKPAWYKLFLVDLDRSSPAVTTTGR